MARSRWKFLYFKTSFWKNTFVKYLKKNKSVKRKINISNKATSIPKIYLYTYLSIHKGNIRINKKVNKWMIGRKVGEFAFTRKPFFFPIKIKNKR